MQVHDELVFEVPTRHLEEQGRYICEIMENVAPGFLVPLPVRAAYGKRWGSLKPLHV